MTCTPRFSTEPKSPSSVKVVHNTHVCLALSAGNSGATQNETRRLVARRSPIGHVKRDFTVENHVDESITVVQMA